MGFAHHGWSGYDSSQTLSLTGTIQESGTNIRRLRQACRPDKVWLVVLAPPSRMENRGLTADHADDGTTVTVVGYPHRSDPGKCGQSALHPGADGGSYANASPARPGLVGVAGDVCGRRRYAALALALPGVEIVHIVGFVILVGLPLCSICGSSACRATCQPRIWPVTSALGARQPGAHPPLGAVMFIAHATEWAASPAFRLKLILIAAAGLNAALFHRGVFQSVAGWNRDTQVPSRARCAAVVPGPVARRALLWSPPGAFLTLRICMRLQWRGRIPPRPLWRYCR